MVKNIDVTIKFLSKVFPSTIPSTLFRKIFIGGRKFLKKIFPSLYQGQFFVKVDGLYLNFFKEIFHTPLYIQGHFFAFHNRNVKNFFRIRPYNQVHLCSVLQPRSTELFWESSRNYKQVKSFPKIRRF